MDIAAAARTGPRRSYGAYINLGLWALALAVILRLWRAGDWHFWRGSVAIDRSGSAKPEQKERGAGSAASVESSAEIDIRSAHALVQTPAEKPIVVSISELDDDPSVAVYDVELRRRHHHHH